jgi:chemotaxis protein MotB
MRAQSDNPVLDSPEMDVDGVEVVRQADAVTLKIAEVVLFDSSRAMLKFTAAPVLGRAIMLLKEFGEVDVAVQGHTDNQPMRGGEFRSNWELSAARANAVATFLMQQGFPPERLRVESYADTRPVAENDTPTGRAKNRRVELRVELPSTKDGAVSALPHYRPRVSTQYSVPPVWRTR